jgi:hypothetical protein
MVDSIGSTQEGSMPQAPPSTPSSTQQATAPSPSSQAPGSTSPPDPKAKNYDARYYSGFLTTDILQTNNANVNDNLWRNLKLAGAVLLTLLLLVTPCRLARNFCLLYSPTLALTPV